MSIDAKLFLKWVGIFVGALLVGLFVFGFLFWFVTFVFHKIAVRFQFDLASLSQIGDGFGVLNAIISAFAFTALLITLVLQKHSLDAQIKQITHQRAEDLKERNLQRYATELEAIKSHLDVLQARITQVLLEIEQTEQRRFWTYGQAEKDRSLLVQRNELARLKVDRSFYEKRLAVLLVLVSRRVPPSRALREQQRSSEEEANNKLIEAEIENHKYDDPSDF